MSGAIVAKERITRIIPFKTLVERMKSFSIWKLAVISKVTSMYFPKDSIYDYESIVSNFFPLKKQGNKL